ESAVSFIRKAKNSNDCVLTVCNFTPVPRYNYTVGVPRGGYWREILNSDAEAYGGSALGNFGGLEAAPLPAQRRFHSLSLTLPPLAIVLFKPS
ncbi:MAG: alpha amylase C-terminal domain-containing protein, partial [Burkholderiales bacterium]